MRASYEEAKAATEEGREESGSERIKQQIVQEEEVGLLR